MTRRDFLFASAAAAGSAAVTRQPNLLFIVADQFRFDALSSAGNKIVSTPNLDRLGREGVRFETAMCPCPVCVPSRTGMLTGKSMINSKVRNNIAAGDTELNPGPSFDNLLHDRGYKSQYYGKWHSPYKMARSYDNSVAAIGVKLPSVHNEEGDYRAFIDEHVPKRPLRKGELLSWEHLRPYVASPADGHYEQAQHGIDPGHADKGYNQQLMLGHLEVPKEYTRAAYTIGQGLKALDAMKDGPFSLTCSLDPPHPPFFNPDPYWEMYPWRDMPLPKNFNDDLKYSPYKSRAPAFAQFQNPDHVKQMTSIYYGMVKEVDDQIGRLLKRLDDLGLTQNTLVIFTADHGELMGSHKLVSKMDFYEESVHVPLLMRLPGTIKPNTVMRDPVSGLDLFSTISDYLALQAPKRDGDSLRPPIEAGKTAQDYRISEWDAIALPNYMVRTSDWKLMIAEKPESKSVDALYDLKNDPYEMRNLLGDPADRSKNLAKAGEMKDRLLEWLARVESPAQESVKSRKFPIDG